MRTIGRLALLAVLPLAIPAAAWAANEPRIRTVNPSSGVRGATVDAVIEGQNLAPYEEISCDRSDVSMTVQPGAQATRISVRFTITEAAAPGSVKITIKTKQGSTYSERFQVRLRLPTVSRVAPDSLPRGGDHDLVVSGSNLSFAGQDTKVSVEDPLAVKFGGKPTDRSLPLKVSIPADAEPGPRSLTIQTSDGKATASFQVVLAPPVVASVVPASVARGASADVEITGKNLAGAGPLVAAVPEEALTIVSRGAPKPDSVSVRVSARVDALPGPRTLVLQTPDGAVAIPFTVETPALRLARFGPGGLARGTETELDVGVEGAPGAPNLRILPAEPQVTLDTVRTGKPLLRVAADALPGPRTVLVETPFGVLVGTVVVHPRGPQVAAVRPAEAAPGTETEIEIEGRDLEGSSVSVAGGDPSVEVAPGPRPLTWKVRVAADARPGPRPLLVRTADGAAVALLTVSGAAPLAPLVSGVTPQRAPRGAATEITLTGLHLRGDGDTAPEVSLLAEGAPLPVEVVASTPSVLKVRVTPPADASFGGAAVLVRTAAGAGAGAFTVVPASPIVAEVQPKVVVRPGEARLVLTGQHLVGGPQGPKVTLGRADGGEPETARIVSAAPDRLEAVVSLPEAAKPGPYLVVLETSEGVAAAVVAVEAAPPVVETMTPERTGVPGNTVFRVQGKNLLGPGGRPPEVLVTRVGGGSVIAPQLLSAAADALQVRIATLPGTPPVAHLVVVRTADGASAALFRVVPFPTPTVSGIAPGGASALQTVTVVVTGSGLRQTTRVAFDHPGITAVVVPGTSESELTLRVTVADKTPRGAYGFTVEGPGGFGPSDKVVFKVK